MFNIHINLAKCRIPSLLASAKASPHYIMSDAPPYVMTVRHSLHPGLSLQQAQFHFWNIFAQLQLISISSVKNKILLSCHLKSNSKNRFSSFHYRFRRHCSYKFSLQKAINTWVVWHVPLSKSGWITRARESLTWALASSTAWVKQLKPKASLIVLCNRKGDNCI